MRIEKVTAKRVGQFLYAIIECEGGLIGIGESGAWGHIEASAAAIEKFGEYLVGKTSEPIEHHWNVMHRFSYFQGAAINGAISAIDIALWDIKGKHLGVPIYELLGGATRSKARVYGHAYDKTAEAVAKRCKRLKEIGFTAIGHLNPFLDEEESKPHFKPHLKFVDDAVKNVAMFREAVGRDCDLLLELHRRLTVAEAVAFMRAVEPYGPMWCEDPIRPEDKDSMAWLASQSAIPIATGERFISIYEFQTLLSRKAMQFARTSLGLCGGITGGRKIAAIAEAVGVQIAPHSPLSPISLAASLQLAAAIPNFAIQEFTTGFDNHQMQSSERLLGHDIADWAPEIRDGHIDIPSGPGLGVSLLPNATAIRPVVTKKVSMRSFYDGSPMDQ